MLSLYRLSVPILGIWPIFYWAGVFDFSVHDNRKMLLNIPASCA